MLDLSRIESGRYELHEAPLKLASVVDEALDAARRALERMIAVPRDS